MLAAASQLARRSVRASATFGSSQRSLSHKLKPYLFDDDQLWGSASGGEPGGTLIGSPASAQRFQALRAMAASSMVRNPPPLEEERIVQTEAWQEHQPSEEPVEKYSDQVPEAHSTTQQLRTTSLGPNSELDVLVEPSKGSQFDALRRSAASSAKQKQAVATPAAAEDSPGSPVTEAADAESSTNVLHADQAQESEPSARGSMAPEVKEVPRPGSSTARGSMAPEVKEVPRPGSSTKGTLSPHTIQRSEAATPRKREQVRFVIRPQSHISWVNQAQFAKLEPLHGRWWRTNYIAKPTQQFSLVGQYGFTGFDEAASFIELCFPQPSNNEPDHAPMRIGIFNHQNWFLVQLILQSEIPAYQFENSKEPTLRGITSQDVDLALRIHKEYSEWMPLSGEPLQKYEKALDNIPVYSWDDLAGLVKTHGIAGYLCHNASVITGPTPSMKGPLPDSPYRLPDLEVSPRVDPSRPTPWITYTDYINSMVPLYERGWGIRFYPYQTEDNQMTLCLEKSLDLSRRSDAFSYLSKIQSVGRKERHYPTAVSILNKVRKKTMYIDFQTFSAVRPASFDEGARDLFAPGVTVRDLRAASLLNPHLGGKDVIVTSSDFRPIWRELMVNMEQCVVTGKVGHPREARSHRTDGKNRQSKSNNSL